MAHNITSSVALPWGFNMLHTQQEVRATWKFQIFGSMVLGGYLWDFIVSIPGDCEFVFRRRFNYTTIFYIVNRISCIISLTNSWLFSVYTGNNCLLVYKLAVIAEPFTIFTSQALLLIRVRVLYKDNHFLLAFMTLFLFASPLLDLVFAFITTALNVSGNVGCTFGVSSPYVYLVFLLQGIFDCLCFVLCTYKLYTYGQGNGLMRIGRELLDGGVVYYIPNVITQLATVVLALRKGSEDQYLLPPAADGVASAQALRITRRLWKIAQMQQNHSEYVDDSLNGKPHCSISTVNSEPPQQIMRRLKNINEESTSTSPG